MAGLLEGKVALSMTVGFAHAKCPCCAYMQFTLNIVFMQAVVSRCLTYLDNGVVFVGSTYGDSNLVKVWCLFCLFCTGVAMNMTREWCLLFS